MRETRARPSRTVRGREPSTRELVLATAVVMIAAQVAFRGWALYRSWFYTDDYRLLSDAGGGDLGWSYLSAPFDSQFMPFGRAVAWVVASSGQVNWVLAATITLGLQLLACAACLWMLVTLFGHRWGILAPLGVYLTCAITMPALMWWAASLNQLPLQVVMFASIGCWVRHLRTHRRRWLAATLVVLAVGLLCYVKTVLVFAVLAYLLVAYFSAGRPRVRLLSALRRTWPAVAALLALGTVFSVYYVVQVPQLLSFGSASLVLPLARTMIGSSFATGAIGGPWRWSTYNPPTGYADPPGWTVALAWVLLALVVVLVVRRRARTGRAWLLLLLYLAAAYVLLLTSRAQLAGAQIGTEYRYLTDVVPVLALCLGLATMPVLGAVESSVERAPGATGSRGGGLVPVALVAALCVSGVFSSRAYARIWHDDNPGDAYVHAAMAGLEDQGAVDLADQVVPASVIPGYSSPSNTTARLLPLVVDNARFPDVTSRLVALDDGGTPHPAVVDPVTTSPRGPERGCGWKIDRGSVTIPLDRTTYDLTWWVSIGYLGSADDTLQIRIGDAVTTAPVQPGLHTVFIRTTGAISRVTLGGLSQGSTLCVDRIKVGNAVPGGAAL